MITDLNNPGVRVQDREEANMVQQALAAVCGKLHRPKNFVGAQPVTFQHEHLDAVKAPGSYVVCEKTDGQRYLLLFWHSTAYLITKRDVFRVDGQLPLRLENVHGTLLDGELVLDRIGNAEPAITETNFYVFDAISVRTVFIGDLSLSNRLRAVVGNVLSFLQPNAGAVVMNLKLKKMYAAVSSRHVWDNIIQAGLLPHESDGLIYTKDVAPYVAGTCWNGEILKWKPSNMNSIDWGIGSISAVDDSGQVRSYFCRLFWGIRGKFEPYGEANIHLEESAQEELREAASHNENGMVVAECFWDKTWCGLEPPNPGEPWSSKRLVAGGGWRFMRIRRDKDAPNDKRTCESTLHTIRNPLESDDLFRALEDAA